MNKPNLNFKPRVNPLIADLSEFLKNPANFAEIQAKLVASVQTTCTHSDVLEMAKCEKCTKNMIERRKLLKKLGFKNPRQYMEWRKIHLEVRKRFPLMDWKLNKPII